MEVCLPTARLPTLPSFKEAPRANRALALVLNIFGPRNPQRQLDAPSCGADTHGLPLPTPASCWRPGWCPRLRRRRNAHSAACGWMLPVGGALGTQEASTLRAPGQLAICDLGSLPLDPSHIQGGRHSACSRRGGFPVCMSLS